MCRRCRRPVEPSRPDAPRPARDQPAGTSGRQASSAPRIAVSLRIVEPADHAALYSKRSPLRTQTCVSWTGTRPGMGSSYEARRTCRYRRPPDQRLWDPSTSTAQRQAPRRSQQRTVRSPRRLRAVGRPSHRERHRLGPPQTRHSEGALVSRLRRSSSASPRWNLRKRHLPRSGDAPTRPPSARHAQRAEAHRSVGRRDHRVRGRAGAVPVAINHPPQHARSGALLHPHALTRTAATGAPPRQIRETSSGRSVTGDPSWPSRP